MLSWKCSVSKLHSGDNRSQTSVHGICKGYSLVAWIPVQTEKAKKFVLHNFVVTRPTTQDYGRNNCQLWCCHSTANCCWKDTGVILQRMLSFWFDFYAVCMIVYEGDIAFNTVNLFRLTSRYLDSPRAKITQHIETQRYFAVIFVYLSLACGIKLVKFRLPTIEHRKTAGYAITNIIKWQLRAPNE